MRNLRRLAAVLTVLATAIGGGTGLAEAATGPDVSAWQHPHNQPINWAAVRGAGHTFAFIKGTEGTSYVNPWLARDRAGAASAGLARGSYHFASPGLPIRQTALAQAHYYVDHTGKHNAPGDLPPVLDLEVTGGLPAPQLVRWAATWLQEVQHLTGRQPIIYTYPGFWQHQMWNSAALRGYRLWLASYTDRHKVKIPGKWGEWTLWQYTDRGRVPGIPTPADISVGSIDGLAVPTPVGPPPGSPTGNVDGIERVPGGLLVSGWAVDPDTDKPVGIRTYVDGTRQARLTADQPSPDVAKKFPGKGEKHRFSTLVNVADGTHVVCVMADNVARGRDQELGCQSVSLSATPFGELDAVQQQPGGVQVSGWAIDPDSTKPVPIHVYVDGHLFWTASADDPRPDVAAAHPAYGSGRGFTINVPVAAGATRRVCVYAINVGPGDGNPALDCKKITLSTRSVGNIDGVAKTAQGLYVRGWSLDKDTNLPQWVHAYVDGHLVDAMWAYKGRPDVGELHDGYGVFHGFEAVLPWPKDGKPHRLCLYPINEGAGAGHSSLGCHTY